MRLPLVRLLFTTSLLLLAGQIRSQPAVSVPRLTHPGAGQTIYLLMPDRFANGSKDNDTGHLPGGPEDTGFDPTRIGYYHGGDFLGATQKLDYIQGLGTTVVWTTPPFKNNPVQSGSAGYHGYWATDFLNLDPHLGTNEEYREFLRQAHARGLRVYLDIVVNHTADIIKYRGDKYTYIDKATAPYRGADGTPFDERAVAYNGLNDPTAFPKLSAGRSFPYVPVVPPGKEHSKNPAWLNDVTLYHNRGNSTFQGESASLGDFVGLDDLFTEHPRVVQGFIDVFSQWVERGVDGFRIDTMRHVNTAFWQAFNPAIRAKARALGRPDFLQFGEVMNGVGDVAYLSEFSTGSIPADATTDFAFAGAMRKFVSQAGTAAALEDFFQHDDYYTDHDSNVHTSVTLLGNYDIGRWGYFLLQDNPGASRDELADLVRLGHGLLYLSRGMPVLHYGDEQGMVGKGGNDMQAREDMFASQAPDFKNATLLATTRTGADDKFDPDHPFYRFFARLGQLRKAHAALRTGAMILRPTAEPGLFAFSRIDRGEKVEYLAAFNNSRSATLTAAIPTSQPAGARLAPLFDSRPPEAAGNEPLTADANGAVRVTLAPLQFALWRAESPLPVPAAAPRIALVAPVEGAVLGIGSREIDGLLFPTRREIRAEVSGGDGVAEVTFVLTRASRPGQFELLGTDDAAPYRVFWTPPADLAPGEKLEFIATVNDLRGHIAAAKVGGITVAPSKAQFGIAGAKSPRLTTLLPAEVSVVFGETLTLTAAADGSGDLEYQWLRNGEFIRGAAGATYTVPHASGFDATEYRVLVHNLAGTVVSGPVKVSLLPAAASGARIEHHPAYSSRFVAPRNVDVWLPPGYDAHAGERYPVIYMHDGQNLFDPATSYGGVPWSADQAMLRLMQAGKTRGAIIVGIWCTPARFAEYLPQKAVSPEQYAALVAEFKLQPFPPQGDAYLRFLVEELKPFIDHSYHTQPEREHTSTMGSSMGGLISAYAVCEYPDVFGGAGCVSTHWPLGDGVVIGWLAQHLPKPGAHRFYFDHGTETLDAGYEPYQRRVDTVMRAAGYTEGRDWITREFPGAEHSEKSWRQRVDLPLSFLLAP
ncbi:alpha-amylase family glycosyl hydrolase [Opitutus sp. GAS368]|uniref:alpha-amylase family glycosyl hydrolase n=1 Tax=Opitutus sp. GAS368 TaxID=1882749 RepID=UPI000879D3C3|nr:alpha-amylase family glycosyl hydrolase [Opitutus sp. GAS368]SDR96718.1 Glycosidase [Opitutus sp. GAS368]